MKGQAGLPELVFCAGTEIAIRRRYVNALLVVRLELQSVGASAMSAILTSLENDSI